VVRIILPFPAGTGSDLAARLFAERLTKRWKQQVVVENHPGADGIPAVVHFVSAHDDHTLLFAFAAPISINPLIHENLPYDPNRDLVPVAAAIENIFAIAVSSSLGVDSLGALVARARKHAGRLNWTASPGLPQYIFTALQKNDALDMTYVPYRDFTLAVQDLAQGRIDVMTAAVPVLLPLVQSGKARLLMVTSRERTTLAEEVPTAKQAGHPDLLMQGVVGFYGGRDIGSDLKERIAADIRAVATDSAMIAQLGNVGIAVRAGTPAEFAAEIADQRARVTEIARSTEQAK
jgi:tripartite-type tricarboxylate transporter receptor subunit TctC